MPFIRKEQSQSDGTECCTVAGTLHSAEACIALLQDSQATIRLISLRLVVSESYSFFAAAEDSPSTALVCELTHSLPHFSTSLTSHLLAHLPATQQPSICAYLMRHWTLRYYYYFSAYFAYFILNTLTHFFSPLLICVKSISFASTQKDLLLI